MGHPGGILAFETAYRIPAAILAAGLLGTAALAVGAELTRRGPKQPQSRLLEAVLGLNSLALTGVVLGQFHLLPGRCSVGLLIGFVMLAGLLRLILKKPRGEPRLPLSVPRPHTVLWAAGLFLLFTLGPALVLPTGWDELVYRCVIPRRWWADGALLVYDDLPYSGFPAFHEILGWLVAPIESLIAPRLISWSCWALGLALLRQVLVTRLPGWSGMALLAAFALAPATLMIGANCYAETVLFMNLSAMLWIAEFHPPDDSGCPTRATFLLLGFLAGGAAAVKLTGLIFLAVAPALALTQAGRAGAWKQGLARLPALVLTAVLVALPFYLRPYLATGNPFFPYLEAWFTTDPARLATSDFHHDLGSNFGFHTLLGFLTAPLFLAMEERLYDGTFGWQALLILGLVPFGVWRLPERGLARWLSLAPPVLLYVFWFSTAQQARFAVPAAACLLPLAADALRSLSTSRQTALAILLGLAAVASVPWKTAGYYLGSWETVAGVWTWREFVDDGTDAVYLPMVEAVRDHTPPDARVMLFLEHRSLYIPRTCIIGSPWFQPRGLTDLRTDDVSALLDRLDEMGVTHLVLARGPVGPDNPAHWLERMTPVMRSLDAAIQQEKLTRLWQSETHMLLKRGPP